MLRSEEFSAADRRTILWSILLGSVVVLLPFSIEFVVDGAGVAPRWIRVPVADLLIVGAAMLAAITGAFRGGSWRCIPTPPLIVMFVGALATLPRLANGASWTECLQRLDYFILAYAVASVAPIRALRNALLPTLAIATALFLAFAGVQLFILDEPPSRMTALFEDRHLFGGWVAIALAMFAARVPFRTLSGWAALGILVLLTILTSTTLLPLAGLAIGAAVACYRMKGLRGIGIAVSVTVLMGAAFAFLAPRPHALRSVEEWAPNDVGSLEALRLRGKEIDGLQHSLLLATTTIGGRAVEVFTPNWHPPVDPPPDPRREARFAPNYVRQRFLEWQAALNAATSAPVLGTGLGSYQEQVSRNYLEFKKLMTLEPDTQNGYAVELVSTGLSGLVVLIWLLVEACRPGIQSMRTSQDLQDPELARSSLAGLLTISLIGFAIPVFTCFLAALLAFLSTALARSTKSDSHPEGRQTLRQSMKSHSGDPA